MRSVWPRCRLVQVLGVGGACCCIVLLKEGGRHRSGARNWQRDLRTLLGERREKEGWRMSATLRLIAGGCCLSFVVGLSGCAERVLIKSFPPGAKAFVDGQYIGSTPAYSRISRWQVGHPHTYRVEFSDCNPATGTLTTRVVPGRIVGYVFTLGFTSLFKGPRAYNIVDVPLDGGDCETRQAPRNTLD